MRFLPSFCFSSSFVLRADVAAVALGQHVLAQRLDRGARDDLRADRGLDRHVELLARNQVLHPLDQFAAAAVGVAAMHDQAQRIDAIAVDQHVDAHERAGLEALEVVVHRGVAARDRLQLVEEIQHHLGQRQLVADLHLASPGSGSSAARRAFPRTA